MTGVDTNVLVRYLVEDEPTQSRRAAAWFATMAARGGRCYLSPIVLCETVWVLRGAYRIGKDDVVTVLDRLLATKQFVIGEKPVIERAIESGV